MPDAPSPADANGPTYRQSGVDIAAGEALVKAIGPLAAATARPGADGALGGFGGLFDLRAAGYSDPVLVAATDGVGTKLKLAGTAGIHDTVGIDLVAMCVNDLIVQGAEPLFFLDYFATGSLDPKAARIVIAAIAKGCGEAGCALIGGETAEMPGMYGPGDYDLAGFAVGAAERGALLPRDDIAPGDVLLALASSGIHSNGFSLVRRIIETAAPDLAAPAPFAPTMSLGEALMTPTRIYVRPLLGAIRAGPSLKALAHITGGGIEGNLPRVMGANLVARIDLSLLPRVAVFGWLAETGAIAQDEMLTTFNCGAGMIAVVAADGASDIAAALREAGEEVHEIGRIEAGAGAPRVTFEGRPWWTA